MRKASRRNWLNLVDPTVEVTSKATPTASIELLRVADELVKDAITHPYAGCGMAFDGAATGSQTDRRAGVMVAPECLKARAWLTLWGKGFGKGAIMTSVQVETTSSGGIPAAGADVITVFAQQQGGPGMGWVDGIFNEASTFLTGDDPEDAPAAAINRKIVLADSPSPSHEQLRIRNASSFTLMVTDQPLDIE